jgi:hypothetical protein
MSIHDFDFLHGTWRVHNRRLRTPLAGSSEWYEFEARAVERPLWDGQANLEEYDGTLPDGTRVRGLALRLYEPDAQRWTISWASGATGLLDVPMVGTFVDGRGEFLCRDTHAGRPIAVRFVWTSDGPDAARWEQAFSADGGATWETNWIMAFTRASDAAVPDVMKNQIVELRQYELHPGARETLIELFEREFVEPQEAAGVRVIAQYRDLDRPDVFTWLRSFPDMERRCAALGTFYDGPVWAAHRDAANGTMISSDNVRLLRPVRCEDDGFASELVVATIYTLGADVADGFAERFTRTIEPHLVASGAPPFALLETERSPNTFPRLPVREGERAFVWLERFASLDDHARHVAALEADRLWRDELLPALERDLVAPVEIWRLVPTAQSRMPR